MLDSGTVDIFSVEDKSERGGFPVWKLEELKAHECYEERTVGLTRFFTGKQASVSVDMLIRIWQNKGISSQDVARIDGKFYKIKQAQHLLDKDELPVTDLTLERTVERYDAI